MYENKPGKDCIGDGDRVGWDSIHPCEQKQSPSGRRSPGIAERESDAETRLL